jgi:hypothetical protein
MKTERFGTNGNFTIQSDFNRLISNISKFEDDFGIVSYHYTRVNIAPKIVDYIQQLMLAGGSDKPQFSWGYWERAGGEYVYKKGKAKYFSGSFVGKFNWGNTSGRLKRFPIHPRSYMARKVRRRPERGQFALIDTKELFNSFGILSSYHFQGGSETSIGSTSFKLDFHENGTKRVPKRQIIAPTVDWFNNNKTLQNKIMSDICKRLRDKLIR